MRTIYMVVSILALMLVAPSAWAAPFVNSDSYAVPSVIPDRFRVVLDGGVEVVSLPFSGTIAGIAYTNIVHYDLTGLATGAHVINVRACKGDPLWSQEVCSAATPFSFAKPVAPGAPPLAATGIFLGP